jgi:cell division protein ZapA
MQSPEHNNSHSPSRPVSVEIYDQPYTLRGPDPKHIASIADVVDSKMRAVAQHTTTVDSLRVAVLASLNIADELLTLRQRYDTLLNAVVRSESTMRSRSANLNGMLDQVLEELEQPPIRRAS